MLTPDLDEAAILCCALAHPSLTCLAKMGVPRCGCWPGFKLWLFALLAAWKKNPKLDSFEKMSTRALLPG